MKFVFKFLIMLNMLNILIILIIHWNGNLLNFNDIHNFRDIAPLNFSFRHKFYPISNSSFVFSTKYDDLLSNRQDFVIYV